MTHELTTPPRTTARPRRFTMLLSSTRRGAHLARLLAVDQLRDWHAPSGIREPAEVIVSELAANAALHGVLPGRGFRLTLLLSPGGDRLRIEVTDGCGERRPPEVVPPQPPGDDAESGRGLILVDALAERWGTEAYAPSGKTVWAEVTER
ncbi:ATP-binding protein [Streptomyces sp. NPDC054784]